MSCALRAGTLRLPMSGRFDTVAAPTAREPDPEMAAVSAARAAVASLTRSLALDLAADRILVNAVSVGLVDTARQRARYERATVDEPYPYGLRPRSNGDGYPCAGPAPLKKSRGFSPSRSPRS
jgi:NAD(P)-dependent dehydrogenase (short-subunit alcohol dehydrogenase family)